MWNEGALAGCHVFARQQTKMLTLSLLSLLLLFAVALPLRGDVTDCKVAIAGKNFDLSSLKKEYTWNQTVYNTADNILTNLNFSDTVSVSFQLGICQNVSNPMSGCSGAGPLFMMRADLGKCISLGSLNVARFEPNPFQDGVYLDYYDGDMIDHITRYEARVYFVCGKDELDGPFFEHLKDSNQAHFHISTKYAC